MLRFSKADKKHMQRAIELARWQLGKTSPNPPVGCVIVDETDMILGEGATGDGGRPHAEERILDDIAHTDAFRAAQHITAYVTLEPCRARSSGRASCSMKLISAGVQRVVVAQIDPHPLASGGCEALRKAGVQVDEGLCAEEAAFLTRGFFKLVETGYPLLKLSNIGDEFDAAFTLNEDETVEQALFRQGQAGLTRLYVKPGTDLAHACIAARLIDE